ncbi:hypothetical protein CERSUDRAFT_37586, partial [Gelatoporia subvermispora B]
HLGKIPMVIGMRILVTQNFDVDGGIVNGSMGVLKQIRYTTDSEGRRYALSCIVRLDDADDDCEVMQGMDPCEVPVLCDEVQFT